MCGRYSLLCTDDLGNRFRVYDPSLGRRSRFNVAPSQTMPVIVRRERAELVPMAWGLVSQWAKDPGAVRRPINARAETLAEQPMFRGPLGDNRCLVPASGFYEWRRDSRGRKTPYYFRLKDANLFAFAGLYDVRRDAGGAPLATYAIITTAANGTVAPIHDRMPVILRREDEERWLGGGPLPPETVRSVLGPYPADAMEAHPVSSQVNSPASDDPFLIAPLEEEA